ncbi:hypothetical protein Tco_0451902, partial [Tanacetum coccineum]
IRVNAGDSKLMLLGINLLLLETVNAARHNLLLLVGREIADIDADAEVTLIDETLGGNDDNLMFDTCVLDEQEVKVEKEERIAREKEEANTALIAQWNDIQDKVESDYELA